MAKRQEPWGETPAAIIGAVFALAIDKVLLIDKWTEHLPVILRVAFIALMAIAAYAARRYYIILDGADEPRGSYERARYDSLRERLSAGGTPAIVYNRWLTFALERVDRFFGDMGRNDRSLIARALHLETQGPRWTAVAFDRCLLIALIYPIVAVFTLWALSGHVGIAEHALSLPIDDPSDSYPLARRCLMLVMQLAATYTAFHFVRDRTTKSAIWFGVAGCIAAFGALVVAGGAVAGAFAVAGIVVCASAAFGALAHNDAVAGAFAFAVTIAVIIVVAVASAVAGANAGAGVGAIALAAGLTAVVLAVVTPTAAWGLNAIERGGRQGPFMVIYCIVLAMGCFSTPYYLATFESWDRIGPLILFFGLLTLVNAPVDWLAIGFTRALLRRGLSRAGWWPFLYAMVDVAVAAILIAMLAFAMVLAVQIFDDVAVLRAGRDARILPLGSLFEGLSISPSDYEYWWIWLLLFSSMAPSILNLSIAAAAFLRGLPPINEWLLRRMPLGRTVRQHERFAVSAVLTGQLVGGIALTGIATYFTGAYLVPRLPLFGGVLRHFASDLAAYNAPARIFIWFSGLG
jgi:hypothetical protein